MNLGPGPRGFRALLGDRDWRVLLDLGIPRGYRRAEFLLRQGDHGGFLLALTAGRVAVSGREANGSELLIALRGPGDLVGELAADPTARRTATVRSLDQCVTRYLSAAAFHWFLTDRGCHGAYTDYLVTKLSETVPYQVRLAHFTPRQRIARLLLDVVALAGPAQADRRRVPFSQPALAAALGLARSTVAEQVAVLRRAGALGPGPRLVVADTATLAAHAGVGWNPAPNRRM